jgi:exodeoxyribonuclease-3
LPTVLEVLKSIEADVVCLQELKCETSAFPYLEIEEQGWNCAVHGQKTYNGVAILSKFPLEDISKEMGSLKDEQARYIEATVLSPRPVRVAGIYVPNGNPAPGEKYDYKLEWSEALKSRPLPCCAPNNLS